MDLSNLQSLFDHSDQSMPVGMDLSDAMPQTMYYIYPQAFLKRCGHFQAHNIIGPIQDLVDKLNLENELHPNEDVDDGSDDADNDDSDGVEQTNWRHSRIVTGTSCQVYNEAMHRIRPLAKYHDVQLGLLTATFSGTYATAAKDKLTFQGLCRKMRTSLPHTRFAEKISTPNLKKELRFENTYTVNLFALPKENRTGQYVIVSIVHMK
jgi:hypothetical protein